MGTLWVRPEPASAATVRHNLTVALRRIDLRSDVLDDVLLVATELVSNAVRHARALPSGGLTVRWDVDTAWITISVTDGGGQQQPRPRTAAPAETTGRGLSIVDALADRWGVDGTAGTVTVWACLPVDRGRALNGPRYDGRGATPRTVSV